jgi:NAD(P)-dependent dehydrogenase (short-subunit alcohol dehydrogenase family)
MSAVTTPFGFESTAAEVAAGIDLTGANAIVTGAASGIGVETARVLASIGATVTLAVRDVAAGERVADGIPGASVEQLDLADPASVDAFVARWTEPLHLLVNNAGVMALPELTLTPQGQELQFATNHLGHFRLAVGLHEALAADGRARIVSLSSSAHLQSPVIFDDLDFAFREYTPFSAYGQSKTANVLFAVEATRRWAADGITANAVMPGSISTALQRHADPEMLRRARAQLGPAFRQKTIEQGAATSVLVATSPLLEGVGGRYFDDCEETVVVSSRASAPPLRGVAPYALDRDNAARLWDVSLELVKA